MTDLFTPLDHLRAVRGNGRMVAALMEAARSFGAGQTIHLESLAVRAWVKYPALFGMKHHCYPDVNRVKVVIDGKRGLVASGLLDRVGANLLRVRT